MLRFFAPPGSALVLLSFLSPVYRAQPYSVTATVKNEVSLP